MNWVGGARQRIRMQRKNNDRKQQEEFFEKKRFANVVTNLKTHKPLSLHNGISQDLLFLQTADRCSRTKTSRDTVSRLKKVDFGNRLKGLQQVGLELPMSPITVPSFLTLSEGYNKVQRSQSRPISLTNSRIPTENRKCFQYHDRSWKSETPKKSSERFLCPQFNSTGRLAPYLSESTFVCEDFQQFENEMSPSETSDSLFSKYTKPQFRYCSSDKRNENYPVETKKLSSMSSFFPEDSGFYPLSSKLGDRPVGKRYRRANLPLVREQRPHFKKPVLWSSESDGEDDLKKLRTYSSEEDGSTRTLSEISNHVPTENGIDAANGRREHILAKSNSSLFINSWEDNFKRKNHASPDMRSSVLSLCKIRSSKSKHLSGDSWSCGTSDMSSASPDVYKRRKEDLFQVVPAFDSKHQNWTEMENGVERLRKSKSSSLTGFDTLDEVMRLNKDEARCGESTKNAVYCEALNNNGFKQGSSKSNSIELSRACGNTSSCHLNSQQCDSNMSCHLNSEHCDSNMSCHLNNQHCDSNSQQCVVNDTQGCSIMPREWDSKMFEELIIEIKDQLLYCPGNSNSSTGNKIKLTQCENEVLAVSICPKGDETDGVQRNNVKSEDEQHINVNFHGLESSCEPNYDLSGIVSDEEKEVRMRKTDCIQFSSQQSQHRNGETVKDNGPQKMYSVVDKNPDLFTVETPIRNPCESFEDPDIVLHRSAVESYCIISDKETRNGEHFKTSNSDVKTCTFKDYMNIKRHTMSSTTVNNKESDVHGCDAETQHATPNRSCVIANDEKSPSCSCTPITLSDTDLHLFRKTTSRKTPTTNLVETTEYPQTLVTTNTTDICSKEIQTTPSLRSKFFEVSIQTDEKYPHYCCVHAQTNNKVSFCNTENQIEK